MSACLGDLYNNVNWPKKLPNRRIVSLSTLLQGDSPCVEQSQQTTLSDKSSWKPLEKSATRTFNTCLWSTTVTHHKFRKKLDISPSNIHRHRSRCRNKTMRPKQDMMCTDQNSLQHYWVFLWLWCQGRTLPGSNVVFTQLVDMLFSLKGWRHLMQFVNVLLGSDSRNNETT